MTIPWLEAIKKLPRIPAVVERYAIHKARKCVRPSIAATSSASGSSTLWVDISVISRRDAGSGIQRVVRALKTEMQTCVLADGWRIQPVAATPGQPYRAIPWQTPTVNHENCPKMDPQAGDVFLGLDLSAHIVPRHQAQLDAWKSRGLTLVFVIYDLLPLHHPDWFSAKLVRAFRRWIKSVAILADHVFCISQPVKQDFETFMQARYGLQPGTIAAHVFPMGADIQASQPSTGLPEGFAAKLNVIGQGKAALMVGTIEPRKGYGQMLDVFEQLWGRGSTHRLVIVGRPGWMTESLRKRITANAHLDDKLFWFDNASDEALHTLYEQCTGVIVASYAEGYGLPLLEALGHGKPVLARDLDVFRQFHTARVSYFTADASVDALSAAVMQWLANAEGLPKPESITDRLQIPTWRASLNSLLGQLLPQAYPANPRSEFA